MSDPYQKFSPIENAVLGVVSGSLEVCLLQPMLYWKNASQKGEPAFTLNPKLLYRGLGASVLNMGVLIGAQFPLTGLVTKVITGGENRQLTNGEIIGSSFMGGWLSGFACGPIEAIMIQQQAFGGTLIGTTRRLYSNFGPSIYFRAVSMTCGREAFFAAGWLGLAPICVRTLREQFDVQETQAKLLGPMAAGLFASTLSHPLDTIKTNMQADLERKTFGGVVATAKTLWAEGGLKRIFLGWGWRTGRMMGSFFVLGECKTLLAPRLFPDHFKETGTEVQVAL